MSQDEAAAGRMGVPGADGGTKHTGQGNWFQRGEHLEEAALTANLVFLHLPKSFE